ncbi:LOW QUALITY PROTEIN: phospholipase D beta 1-like [Primulina eburnea]|uniref:LOW QUALITY PROTEIN: phospholipase D beta 1-like n=1 Tax=Primulina eburnea TaxID=1245227 RepID=UPI003C6CC303
MAHFAYSESMSEGSQHGQSVEHVPFKTSSGSLKVLLLHGNLDIWVKEAKNLPNMDTFHQGLGDMFGKLSVKFGGKVDGNTSNKVTSDPYVTIVVSNAVIGRTFVIKNTENPVWEQHFHVPVAHYGAEIQFVVKDSDVVGSQIIGAVGIPVEELISGVRIEGTYPILGANGKPCNEGAILSLSIQYITIENVPVPLYHGGVGVGSDRTFQGVPRTYFPLRSGGKVTLYQDAHFDDHMFPTLYIAGGKEYVPGSCWHDIFVAISQARRLIYITGWSVYHLVQLVRGDSNVTNSTLGEILKAKSEEGVRVLILVWDDPTSRSLLGYKHEGIMDTGDEDTHNFFKHSSVQVLLCPRTAKKGSWVKQQETGTIYTHHQKSVIVDADAGNFRRKVIGFVGGLDLCKGRYDTRKHAIFSTLQSVHKDDYHNPNYTGPAVGCPREPWHDLHCRIDGPAAYDILTNFEERWKRASKQRSSFQKMKALYDDSLLKLERIPDMLGLAEVASLGNNDQESWHVQVFRSIDSNSVKGFPKDPKEATDRNLVCGKNVLIDMSIHTAYVEAIRAAQRFIYIENQYFIGSSFNWDNYKDLGANNLIPMEIALKIANKIRAKERFSVFIVIPMWPEGVPTSTPTQRILFWQYNTMQMMYETIYKSLVEVGLENEYEPQDYLNFFCLGNREADNSGGSSDLNVSFANTPQELSKKNRRFMIYVHSKGIIVDDEYVMIGSANINQRSLEGTRDTEIAIGAYQPRYTWARRHPSPHGEIYGYRMALWAEHTGTLEECFEHPESIECTRRIKWMGEQNWKQFAADEISEMIGHLLKYPVEVDRMGKVKPLPGCETFPDMGGKIIGTFSGIQENLTI